MIVLGAESTDFRSMAQVLRHSVWYTKNYRYPDKTILGPFYRINESTGPVKEKQ